MFVFFYINKYMDLQFMQLGQVQVKVESTMEKIDREMQKKKTFPLYKNWFL